MDLLPVRIGNYEDPPGPQLKVFQNDPQMLWNPAQYKKVGGTCRPATGITGTIAVLQCMAWVRRLRRFPVGPSVLRVSYPAPAGTEKPNSNLD